MRPPRLPFAARRIVAGSRRLTDGQKLVWLQLHALDRGDERGAWIGAVALSECVGRPVETVERQRKELQELGLLQGVQMARGKSASWYVLLPPGAVPESPRPVVDEVRILVGALDRHIAEVGSLVTPLPAQVGSLVTPPGVGGDPTRGSLVTPPLPLKRAESGVTGDPTPAAAVAPTSPPVLPPGGWGLAPPPPTAGRGVALATGKRQENGNGNGGQPTRVADDPLVRELTAGLSGSPGEPLASDSRAPREAVASSSRPVEQQHVGA